MKANHIKQNSYEEEKYEYDMLQQKRSRMMKRIL